MIIAGHEIDIDEKTIKEMAEGARAFGNLDPWDYKRHCQDDAADQVEIMSASGLETMLSKRRADLNLLDTFISR